MTTFALIGADTGRGTTLLFVNGVSAVRPHPVAPENIHAAQLIIPGAIRPDAEPLPDCPQDDAVIPSARTTLARALPATALLLAVTACTAETPSSPSSPPSSSTASAPQRTSTATAPATSTGTAPATPTDKNTAMNIQLTIDGHRIDATLNDSATARDFAALLPLTLPLSDFHQTERIADLPRKLSTAGAPEAAQPKAGDLAYYAPWGNLALFYRDGGSSDVGLIILGRVAAADVERFATATDVTIETAP